jgi:general secretion pathway protein D
MNPRLLRSLALLLAVAGVLTGCAPGATFVSDGQKMIEQGRVEEGLSQIEQAIKLEPENRQYRIMAVRLREKEVNEMLKRADGLRAAAKFDDAVASYRRVIGLDPDNLRARAGIEAVDMARRQRQLVDEAQALMTQGRKDEAEQRLRKVLAEAPNDARALQLKQRIEDQAAKTAEIMPPTLKPSLRKPVTLDFREASLKIVFDALSRTTGINFVFDREVRPDIKVTLSVSNIGIDDVISVLTTTNQLERKVLNDNTVLIYPNTPAKQKDYLDLAVKTFYLSNADVKNVFTMLKTVLKTRDMYADEKLNSLTVRDSPDAIRLAEKLIVAQDLAEPEVTLDVEVLEVKHSRLMALGIDPPTKFSVLNIVQSPQQIVTNGTASPIIVSDNTVTTTQLTLNKLRDVRPSTIGIDNPALNMRAENADTNILANPRIRAKNREKARILIGDRVPVITTTSAINVGVSETVNYLDVGLKLEVEPNVFLDNEVGVRLNLEVSNIVREIRSKSGSLTYQIGTRQATTALRLKDGETQALAGLISDEDRRSTAGWPGAVDLPILGRLFSTESTDRSKTEIVLLITPHIVRNLAALTPDRNEHAGGTETLVGSNRMRLQNQGRISGPPAGSTRTAPASQPQEEGGEPPAPEVQPPADAASGAQSGAE